MKLRRLRCNRKGLGLGFPTSLILVESHESLSEVDAAFVGLPDLRRIPVSYNSQFELSKGRYLGEDVPPPLNSAGSNGRTLRSQIWDRDFEIGFRSERINFNTRISSGHDLLSFLGQADGPRESLA